MGFLDPLSYSTSKELGKAPPWYLREHVAVEESAQDPTLNINLYYIICTVFIVRSAAPQAARRGGLVSNPVRAVFSQGH